MPTLDEALYKWICQANEKGNDLGLPRGFIEDSIAMLTTVLGKKYRAEICVRCELVEGWGFARKQQKTR